MSSTQPQSREIADLLLRIRLSKNTTQVNFSYGVCTQSLLSRIESSTTHPTFIKMIQLLYNANISLTEFEFLLKKENDIVREFTKALYMLNLPFIAVNDSPELQKKIRHFSEAAYWLKYCFGVKIKKVLSRTKKAAIGNILNQDEFFDDDIPFLIYTLPFLELEAALYTFHRIRKQIKLHHLSVNEPFFSITATMSIAYIYLKHSDEETAIYYFISGLEEAKELQSIHHLIILNLQLWSLTMQFKYKNEAIQVKTIFSKDNFYEYWYNVIIRSRNKHIIQN